jgi:hypothetical protein
MNKEIAHQYLKYKKTMNKYTKHFDIVNIFTEYFEPGVNEHTIIKCEYEEQGNIYHKNIHIDMNQFNDWLKIHRDNLLNELLSNKIVKFSKMSQFCYFGDLPKSC